MFQALADIEHLQDLLLFFQLERKMRGNGVGKTTAIINSGKRGQDFRRDLLVQLDVLVELGEHGAHQCADFVLIARLDVDIVHARHHAFFGFRDFGHLGTTHPLHQHLDRTIRQLQHLQNGSNGADLIQVLGFRLILVGGGLGHEQNLLVLLRSDFQCFHRLGSSDKKWDDQMRIHYDIAQWQQGQKTGFRGNVLASIFCHVRTLEI